MRERPTVSLGLTLAAAFLLAACAGPTGTTGSAPGAETSPPPGASPAPSDATAPAEAAPTAAEPAITFISPAVGASLTTPVRASGTANTFEAALTVDAINEAGDVMCVRNIMATSGSGTPGTWDTDLGIVPEGSTDASITLRAYEFSAADGSIINLVERAVILSPQRPKVLLTSPVCGDKVAPGGKLSLQGLADVFEAALTVELRDSAGTVVASWNLMTSDGQMESPFGETVTVPAGLPSGFYDVVAFDISPKDGSIQNEFPVQILVQS